MRPLSKIKCCVAVAGMTMLFALPWATAQEPETKKASPKFQMYTWNCSRSIKMVLATDNLSMVQAEVEKAKKAEAKFRVTTGQPPEGLAVLRSPKTFEVYVNQCRGGWRLAEKATTEVQASKLIEQYVKNGANGTVIVGSYQ